MKTKTTALPHPPYSPDFAPYDFIIFRELARLFQGRQFQFADEIKSASQAELKNTAKNGFQKCFENPYKR
ncbi:hypothetical protein TNCV_836071 [Trichonephila clavipes]|nr:hypothetical protein TNCV_836071 [Trichonephila clavipes]